MGLKQSTSKSCNKNQRGCEINLSVSAHFHMSQDVSPTLTLAARSTSLGMSSSSSTSISSSGMASSCNTRRKSMFRGKSISPLQSDRSLWAICHGHTSSSCFLFLRLCFSSSVVVCKYKSPGVARNYAMCFWRPLGGGVQLSGHRRDCTWWWKRTKKKGNPVLSSKNKVISK